MTKIEIRNFHKDIKGNKILEDINITFESGKIYGLKGRNGSGKTMLMRAISGLIKPTQGKILINNEELGKDISFPRSIGILIEKPGLNDNETVLNSLLMISSIKKIVSKNDIIALLNLFDLDYKEKKRFKNLSLGTKQKAGIIVAIMEKPDIIILDEPFNGLDESSVKVVKNILLENKERGALCIISCHNNEDLEFLSDEIIPIDCGKILSREIGK